MYPLWRTALRFRAKKCCECGGRLALIQWLDGYTTAWICQHCIYLFDYGMYIPTLEG